MFHRLQTGDYKVYKQEVKTVLTELESREPDVRAGLPRKI